MVRGREGVAAGQGRRAGAGKGTPGVRLVVVLWLLKFGAGRGLSGVPGFGGAAGARRGGGTACRPVPGRVSGYAAAPGGSARSVPAERPERSPPGRAAGLAGGAVLSAHGCGDCRAPPGWPRPGRTGGGIAGSRFQAVEWLSASSPRRGEAEPGKEGALRGARPARRRCSSHAGHLEAAVPCHRVAGWGLGFYSRGFSIFLSLQVLGIVSARFSDSMKRQGDYGSLFVV